MIARDSTILSSAAPFFFPIVIPGMHGYLKYKNPKAGCL